MNNQHFGRLLKALRKEKRMTQQAVADKLGVTNRQISLWETKHSVTSDTIQKHRAANTFLCITITELK